MKRRNVIRSSGLLASIGIVGAAKARKTDEKVGANEVGITDQLEAFLRRGKSRDARSLANEHGITHAIGGPKDTNHVVGSSEAASSESELSIQAFKPKSTSSLTSSLFLLGGNEWRTIGNVHLRGGGLSTDDFAMEKDVMAITWNDSVWASKGSAETDFGVVESGATRVNRALGGSGALVTKVDFKTGDTLGFGGSTDRSDQTLFIRADLKRLQEIEGVGTTLRYFHTGAPVDYGSIGVGITSNGVSVSPGVGQIFWTDAADTEP